MASRMDRKPLDSFHDALHPAFVTSKAVTPEIIDEFLQKAAEGTDGMSDLMKYKSNHAFTLQREYADAERERVRVEAEGHPMYGTKPQVGANPTGLDFEGATLDDLARYVLRNFTAGDVEERDGQFFQIANSNPQYKWPSIDNYYFVVLDQQTARDKSVVVVQIPLQYETSPKTRNWRQRDDYSNKDNWPALERDEELKAVRVEFGKVFGIDMVQLGEISMDEL